MLIGVGFDIRISVVRPTLLFTLLDIHPSRRQDVVAESPLATNPPVKCDAIIDRFGNMARRILLPPGTIDLVYRGTMADLGLPEPDLPNSPDIPVHELPADFLQYLAPSRYCDSDRLAKFAWGKFGDVPAGGARARAVVDFVHTHLRFDYQHASATRSASEALIGRVGVCRDYAHLTIALCRALNMPARYVNGYLGDIGVPPCPLPMDFSAWCEVLIGGEWITVDARHNVPRIGRIAIARGLDAADVAMLTTYGAHVLERFSVYTDEARTSATVGIAA